MREAGHNNVQRRGLCVCRECWSLPADEWGCGECSEDDERSDRVAHEASVVGQTMLTLVSGFVETAQIHMTIARNKGAERRKECGPDQVSIRTICWLFTTGGPPGPQR